MFAFLFKIIELIYNFIIIIVILLGYITQKLSLA